MENNNNNKNRSTVQQLEILSVHWGFSLGGVAKYSLLIDGVSQYQPVKIKTICVLIEGRQYDEVVLDEINAEIICIKHAGDIAGIKKLFRYIDQSRSDFVMTHGFNAHFMVMLHRWFGNSRPQRISSYHGEYHATTPARQLIEPVYNYFTPFYFRHFVSAIVPVAEHCATHLIKHGVDKDIIQVVHNGIDDISRDEQARDLLRKEWGIADNDIVVGTASRMDPVKGLSYLVKAHAQVVAENRQVKLVILGVGEEEQMLKELVSTMGLNDSVIFPGLRNDVPRCLEAFDIFALPSLAEYHSIGLLEAMRAAKAIVSTDVGGNTESVRDEKEGLVVNSRQVQQLTGALLRMASDPSLRARLGAAAQQRFKENFTSDVMVKRTADWLNSLRKLLS